MWDSFGYLCTKQCEPFWCTDNLIKRRNGRRDASKCCLPITCNINKAARASCGTMNYAKRVSNSTMSGLNLHGKGLLSMAFPNRCPFHIGVSCTKNLQHLAQKYHGDRNETPSALVHTCTSWHFFDCWLIMAYQQFRLQRPPSSRGTLLGRSRFCSEPSIFWPGECGHRSENPMELIWFNRYLMGVNGPYIMIIMGI